MRKQTFQNIEIIVADYNSIDRIQKIARKYGCRITKGGNYAVGRNNGARISRAKYLLFLDADSTLPENFLEVNFNRFKESSKGTGTVSVKPLSNKIVDKILFGFYNLWSLMMSYFSPYCAGCGIFARKDVFDAVGGFDKKVVFAENHDFTKRAKKYGFIILPVPVFTSVRRLDKEGRFKFMAKYFFSGLYRLFYKEIDRKLFEYQKNDAPPRLKRRGL